MNGNIPCILCFKFGRIIRGSLLVVVIKRNLLKARKEDQTPSVLKTVKRKMPKMKRVKMKVTLGKQIEGVTIRRKIKMKMIPMTKVEKGRLRF